MEAPQTQDGKKLVRLVQPNFFFLFEGAMFNLRRRHYGHDFDRLKNGWIIGQWEGSEVRFFPSMRHGQPSVTAHGLAQAIWRELATFGPEPPKKLHFSKRKLLLATGKTWSKANRDFGMTALQQIAHSYLEFETHNGGERSIKTVRLLQEVLVELDDASGATESVTLTLSDFAYESLVNKDVLLFNWSRLDELGGDPIAINLAKYFVHRGYRLTSRKTGETQFSRRKGFSKDYHAVCDEYLGGLTRMKTKSEIDRQLGRAFQKIHRARFGAMFVRKSKTSQSGFVIVFKPLDGFYRDHKALFRQPQRRTTQHATAHQENDASSAPVMLAGFFHRQLGRSADHAILSSEVSYLKGLLSNHSYSEVEQLIEHAAQVCKKNQRLPERATALKGFEDAWHRHRAEKAAKACVETSIETCALCGADGMVMLQRQDGTPIAHRCPHDQAELIRISSEKGLCLPANMAA